MNFDLDNKEIVWYIRCMIKTIKIRIKDSITKKHLKGLSKSVNFVWNYCNEISNFAIKNDSKWLSGFDLNNLTSGSSKELGLNSTTIQEVCEKYVDKRKQFKRIKLRWRGKKSLGWVPFKKTGIQIKEGIVIYNKKKFKVFQPERLNNINYKCGSFVEDARGRWYVCVVIETVEFNNKACGEVGIDLGIKNIATLSDGYKIINDKNFYKYQKRLARSQRNKHNKRTKNIHAKIKNKRIDKLHKESTKIIRENQLIVIGDLKPKKISKTKLAKAILDSGTGMFRTMLEYKARTHQRQYIVVNENNTTRTCSVCGKIPESSPKGLKGLRVRDWTCDCGAILDRDVNAAKNILRLGHQTLKKESPCFS